MARRFGFLDESKNPDLDDIHSFYANGAFLVALDAESVCGTGAYLRMSADTVQIVRVHTDVAYRRRGVASTILQSLEDLARGSNYTLAVLETNDDWDDAIRFYESRGYRQSYRYNEEIHFAKNL